MAPEQTTIIGPDGTPRKAQDIPILESSEKVSEVTLEDGTVLYVKASPISVLRIEGIWDPYNNPTYSVQANTVVSVKHCPSHLKKGNQG